jgi:RNA polymerase sigma factor (sigma-70 family)
MILKEPAVTLGSDPAAFFLAFHPRLYAFVSAATGAPRADVEDIVQETLLQAWRDRGHAASGSAWVTALARHRIADFFRKRQCIEKGDRVLRAVARLDTERIPEEVLADAELGRRVRGALQKIPAGHSRLLLQRHLEGRTIREIAEESGETEAAVESRLRRAHESLRKELQAGGNDRE